MNITLIGVNDDLRNSLEPVLQTVNARTGKPHNLDVIFCAAEAGLIDHVRRSNPEARIVAVSHLAETDRWLDAIEAGADDYCAAPFEAFHLRWTLDGFAKAAHDSEPPRLPENQAGARSAGRRLSECLLSSCKIST